MKSNRLTQFFETFASRATQATGSSTAFLMALLTIIFWLITGPIFGYSDTWQLIINTGTTIITFLMVFLIQNRAGKDSLAMQIKLNELIAVNKKASNHLLNVEDLTEADLHALHDFFGKLAEKAKSEISLYESHSMAEADDIHDEKVEAFQQRRSARHTDRPAQKPSATQPKQASGKPNAPTKKNDDERSANG